jgi:hypothetical protein
MADAPNKPRRNFPPQKSSLGDRMNDTSTMMIQKEGRWLWLDNGEEVKNPPDGSSETTKQETIQTLVTLDSDQIPIRVRFEPTNGRYFENVINGTNSLGEDGLALALMLQYFVLISGGSCDVRELETSFVNRRSTKEIEPEVGELFSGVTFIEMVNRAKRTYRNAKRLPKLYGRSSRYENGQSPLASFSDDEIAELSFVAHASISGAMASGLQIGHYFKNLASEYYNRSKTRS